MSEFFDAMEFLEPIEDLINKPFMAKEEFMESVNINEKTGCWEWNKSRNENRGGYGQKRYKGKTYTAHRLSWWIFKGEFPTGKFVCHKCDNPPCCNPNHLFLGDAKINSLDAWNKGRLLLPTNVRTGENHFHAKLTRNKVFEIKKRLANGEMGVVLAKEYGVTTAAISMIRRGKSWKNITI